MEPGTQVALPRAGVPAQKCSAHTSSGRPCKAWAIIGGVVCRTHGGSAPQVREAARRRILDSVLGNVEQAQAMILDPEIPAATRARLIIDMLDRGLGKALDVHVDVTPGPDNEDLDARLAQALARVHPEDVRTGDLGDAGDDGVLDAEILEPEDPSPS